MTLKELIHHLQAIHKEIEIKEKDFDSLSNLERRREKSGSSFVHYCAPQTTLSGKVKWCYYYCHRSGNYKCKGVGIRQLKFQKSCEVGNSCTAHIKVSEHLDTKLHMEYCFYHHNHEIKITHLKIPTEVKTKMAAKLHKGVGEKTILNEIRDDVHDQLVREHLLTIQDIQGIKRLYNSDGIQHHKNDQETSSQVYNCGNCTLRM